MIEGVKITPLRQILDERGKVMHMLRADTDPFVHFGEIYFSCIYPGAIKAWKLHKEMTLNCAVPHGHIKFVLYDTRKKSSSMGKVQELYMGTDNYYLLTVPPMIWTGFKCIGTETAILANCANMPHRSNEFERCDFNDASIPYNWMTSIC
jgi:dTDP-4-dehydrorhamnose 3,5-epimerase